jgi:hypothetical protein
VCLAGFLYFSETRRVADFLNRIRGVSDMAQSLSKQFKGQTNPPPLEPHTIQQSVSACDYFLTTCEGRE